MSELKAITVLNAYQLEYNDDDLVYLKSEADKVIAEKDKVIAYARCLVREDIKLIRHHKYKRCLDNARWCARYLRWVEEEFGASPYYNYYERWHKRWLEIAEKFKEEDK